MDWLNFVSVIMSFLVLQCAFNDWRCQEGIFHKIMLSFLLKTEKYKNIYFWY